MMEETTYSVSSMADLLGVSNKTVYRWIDEGHVVAEKAAYGTRIPAQELERFLSAGGISQAELAQGTYRVAEIARLLRVSSDKAHCWIREGRLEPCLIAPKTTRVTRSALTEFLGGVGLSIADCEAGLLTRFEVARLLRIHPTNVGLLEKSGELALTRVSIVDWSHLRITQRALDAYLRTKGLSYQDVAVGPLMLLSEVADLLRLDLTTLHRWIRQGKIKAAYLSLQNTRVSRLFLDTYLREQGSSLAEAQKGLLLVGEYAKMHGLKRGTVYRRIATGKVSVIRLSRKALRIPLRERQ